MAVQVKRGSFAANTSTGNQAITGLGYTPSVVILRTVGLTATGVAAGPSSTTGAGTCFGVAVDSTHQWSIAETAQDAVVGANTAGLYTAQACFCTVGAGQAVDSVAALVSMDSGGFTINWSNAPAAALLIEYLAVGGISAYAFADQVRTTTGNESLSGFGFQPKAVIAASGGQSTLDPTTGVRAIPLWVEGLGFAVSASLRGSLAQSSQDTANPTSNAVKQAQRMLSVPQANGIDWEIELVSFDSDGLTYNVADAPTGANADWWFGLALGGSDLAVAYVDDTQKTSTGDKQTSAALDVMGLILMGLGHATAYDGSESLTQPGRYTIGFADSTSAASTWHGNEDNVSTTDVDRSHSQTKVLQYLNNSGTVLAEAGLTSLDAYSFTLNWSTSDGVARQFIGLALGEPPPPPPETHPALDGIFDESTRSGVVVDYERSGSVGEPSHGGTHDESTKSGTVNEPSRSGSFDETATGGEVF